MFSDVTHADLKKWARRLFIFACSVLTLVFGAFALRFGPLFQVSTDPQAWGQFGDFVGGTTNPILAFLSFTALLLTIQLQAKQLEISSSQLDQAAKSLELSRIELLRTAEAQARTEHELSRQTAAALGSARLTSINLLLDNCRRELGNMNTRAYVASDPAHIRMARLEAREAELVGTLELLYTELFPSSLPKEP